MSGIAISQPSEEQKTRRKDHPLGLSAHPPKNPDGTRNLNWQRATPEKQGTPWEAGPQKMQTALKDENACTTPTCTSKPPVLHPNALTPGPPCPPLLDVDRGWRGYHHQANIVGNPRHCSTSPK
ncbi:hypothetical protein HPB49_019965 [Dermacentor silvarum]|uniref:Uncharacterized protein n=1 Tax=Dermacentor silvarum TaxID=543639 RepID=A0ACB8CGX0_DERSI|nr:hypothetical protein HPB49_019965 [Dermacentor silvarum]